MGNAEYMGLMDGRRWPSLRKGTCMIRSFVLFASLCLATVAYAEEYGGVTMPSTLQVAGKKLVLNGIGMREATIFSVDVYVAGLYLEKKSSDAKAILSANQVKRVHMVFKRDVGRDEMIDALNKAFENNAGDKRSALAGHMKTFAGYLHEMKEGTSTTFTHVPGKGLMVAFQGESQGVIASDDFVRVIFAGWLGDDVADEDLREQLLGK